LRLGRRRWRSRLDNTNHTLRSSNELGDDFSAAYDDCDAYATNEGARKHTRLQIFHSLASSDRAKTYQQLRALSRTGNGLNILDAFTEAPARVFWLRKSCAVCPIKNKVPTQQRERPQTAATLQTRPSLGQSATLMRKCEQMLLGSLRRKSVLRQTRRRTPA